MASPGDTALASGGRPPDRGARICGITRSIAMDFFLFSPNNNANVTEAAFEQLSGELFLRFADGAIYRYLGVTADEWRNLRHASTDLDFDVGAMGLFHLRTLENVFPERPPEARIDWSRCGPAFVFG